jgi:hypothetical protein
LTVVPSLRNSQVSRQPFSATVNVHVPTRAVLLAADSAARRRGAINSAAPSREYRNEAIGALLIVIRNIRNLRPAALSTAPQLE